MKMLVVNSENLLDIRGQDYEAYKKNILMLAECENVEKMKKLLHTATKNTLKSLAINLGGVSELSPLLNGYKDDLIDFLLSKIKEMASNNEGYAIPSVTRDVKDYPVMVKFFQKEECLTCTAENEPVKEECLTCTEGKGDNNPQLRLLTKKITEHVSNFLDSAEKKRQEQERQSRQNTALYGEQLFFPFYQPSKSEQLKFAF